MRFAPPPTVTTLLEKGACPVPKKALTEDDKKLANVAQKVVVWGVQTVGQAVETYRKQRKWFPRTRKKVN